MSHSLLFFIHSFFFCEDPPLPQPIIPSETLPFYWGTGMGVTLLGWEYGKGVCLPHIVGRWVSFCLFIILYFSLSSLFYFSLLFSMNYYDTDFFIIFIERVPMLLVSMVSDKVSLFQGGSSCPPAPGIELVPQVVL